jgi:antitoxin (DNA-binding transcriptional repressor) of toxin-antitoxin stability system
VKNLSIREMRSALTQLEEIVAAEGEIVVTQSARRLVRILPARAQGEIPPRAELRAELPKLEIPSQVLIRQDRG